MQYCEQWQHQPQNIQHHRQNYSRGCCDTDYPCSRRPTQAATGLEEQSCQPLVAWKTKVTWPGDQDTKCAKKLIIMNLVTTKRCLTLFLLAQEERKRAKRIWEARREAEREREKERDTRRVPQGSSALQGLRILPPSPDTSQETPFVSVQEQYFRPCTCGAIRGVVAVKFSRSLRLRMRITTRGVKPNFRVTSYTHAYNDTWEFKHGEDEDVLNEQAHSRCY